MPKILRNAYRRLFDAFGPQHWWPGESPWEIVVGAVLTQNTSWNNVERAIENLRDADALDLDRLHTMPTDELAELIRPAGYYRVKARRLKNLIELIVNRFDGSLEELFALGQHRLRDELLAVNGIGPETADSIVLYAAQFPTFVVDAYTARILKRHGWIEPEADYDAIKDYFESNLVSDVRLFNEYHALLVRLGKEFCRKTPKCDECPLVHLLPESGPLLWP